ncbi:MAG TPA: DUF4388 domain-containing protein [Kofleriaceae bacterium]
MTSVTATDELDPAPFAEPAEVVIAGGRSAEEGSAVLAKVRGALVWCGREVPILYVGNGIARPQAVDQGASEFLGQPAFVRDAVTMARLLASPKRENPKVLTGDLAQHFGFYYLVRALSSVKRTGVLTLVRGLRRGELRFFEGEVTSAQAGMLHGLAAFHQLLLWTEGRFELRPEDVVRRRQIPLEPAELFADAERFLAEMIAVGGQLSPAAIYQRDEKQIARMSGTVPDAVDAVLRLFDGQRTVADVVEDCSFRVFETLRLGNRMCELGLISLKQAPRARHPVHAALAIDEWLVGQRSPEQPPEAAKAAAPRHVVIRKTDAIGPPPGQPASPPGHVAREEGGRRKKRRRGHGAAQQPAPARPLPTAAAPEPLVIDWVGVLPAPVGGGDAGVSQVVPSSVAAGEISVGPAYPGQLHGDLRARRERDAAPVAAPARERIEEVAPASSLVQLFTAETPASAPAVPQPPPIPRAAAAPAPAPTIDENAATEPLDRIDPSEASGTIETKGPPPSAAGVIESPTVAPPPAQPAGPAVPSIVVDVGSAPAARQPVSLFDPPPARPASPSVPPPVPAASPSVPPPVPASSPSVPPPVPIAPPASTTAEEHAIAVARKALVDKQAPAPHATAAGKKQAGGPTHPRKPTPPPIGGRRKPTRPPIADSFSDAEEAFFAQGSNMTQAADGDSETFDDLDEGMDLPNTFWKRLFRSPSASLPRNPSATSRPQQHRPPGEPGQSASPPPRRPGPGSRKK